MEETIRRALGAVPVRAVAAEAIGGPDEGARAEAVDTPLGVGSADENELSLRDPTVSRFHVELRPHASGIAVRDLGSTNGVRVGALRLTEGVVPSGTVLGLGASLVRVEDAGVRRQKREPVQVPGFVGEAAATRRLTVRIARAAESDAPVLIEGESGTGKELVARAIHESSARRGGPLVLVDGGAIAPTLVGSELFGHEKGAFTGARERREGALERASGGTLFLDEIGELPASVQLALVGVLARGVVRRVGGDRDMPVDVRVVAATHRDLRAAVNAETFRADLYHRVAVVRLEVPPLRARLDDVPALVAHFLDAAGWDGGRESIVPDEVLERWCAHEWPGNVRELRNAVEAAVALQEPPELDEGLVPPAQGAFAELFGLPFRDARDDARARFERVYLEALLTRTRQNVAEAARVAGVDRGHLHQLLKRYGLR